MRYLDDNNKRYYRLMKEMDVGWDAKVFKLTLTLHVRF
jgi:hypothetical protein